MNVLGIGSHPDDLEIGCGGTLAKYTKNGHNVFMCHIANGNMGHKVILPDDLAVIREKEAKYAAEVLGARAININVDDTYVEASNKEIRKRLIDVICETKPDVIITHNPDDYMRDHVQTSELAYDLSFTSTLPHLIWQMNYLEKIPPIFYMDTLAGVGFIPTEYVDISEEIELKLESLKQHDSQIRWMMEHDKIDFIDFVRTCSKYRGLQCNVNYAEGFKQYAGWPRLATKRLLP